jgi:hypothetical protein
MRRLIDEGGSELRQVLEELLRADVDVTVREIARRHSKLKNPSAFVRNADRMAMIADAQKRQSLARGDGHSQPGSLTRLLEERNARIKVLESQIRALVASHAACVRAVMMHGGTRGLERFWTEYKAIADTVREVGGMPPSADVFELNKKK